MIVRVNVVLNRTFVVVTVNNNNPIENYVHPDDENQPPFKMTPGFKSFTVIIIIIIIIIIINQSNSFNHVAPRSSHV